MPRGFSLREQQKKFLCLRLDCRLRHERRFTRDFFPLH